MPTPMKLNAASVKMASGMPNVREMMIGVRALGSKWRTIIARFRAPAARAASQNSRSLSDNIWARVSRATRTHPVRPMAMKILSKPRPSMDIIMMTKRSLGKAYITSTNRMRIISSRPP